MSNLTEQEKKEVKAAVAIILAVYETIVEMGPQGCPEGPLYQTLQSATGCTFQQYQTIVGMLEKEGKVFRKNHCLFAK